MRGVRGVGAVVVELERRFVGRRFLSEDDLFFVLSLSFVFGEVVRMTKRFAFVSPPAARVAAVASACVRERLRPFNVPPSEVGEFGAFKRTRSSK